MNALTTPKQNHKAALRIVACAGKKEVHEQMADYQVNSDAQWLFAIEQATGWGIKRLRRVYEAFYAIRKREKDFYDSNGYDGILEDSAKNELLKRGIDIEQWFNDVGEMLVSTEFTEQTFREQKEKANQRVTAQNPGTRINPRKEGDQFTVARCCICHEWYEPACELKHICKLQNSYDFGD